MKAISTYSLIIIFLFSCSKNSSNSPSISNVKNPIETSRDKSSKVVFSKDKDIDEAKFEEIKNLVLDTRQDFESKRISMIVISDKDSQYPDPKNPGKFIISLKTDHDVETLDETLRKMLYQDRVAIVEDLNFRSYPGDFGDKNFIEAIVYPYELVKTGKEKENVVPDLLPWIEVYYKGQKGWVYSEYLLWLGE